MKLYFRPPTRLQNMLISDRDSFTFSLHFLVKECPGVHFMSIAASGRFHSTFFSLRSFSENKVCISCTFFRAGYLLNVGSQSGPDN